MRHHFRVYSENFCIWVCLYFYWILLSGSLIIARKPYNLTLGYLTAIQGSSNAAFRQGLVISGAISYAIDQINNNTDLLPYHHLNFIWNDTEADSSKGTRALTNLWKQGAVAFFGPEDTCEKEAFIAAAWNLPMISYVSDSANSQNCI